MRKLLLTLLLLTLPLTACAAQLTVHAAYLAAVTLPTTDSTRNLSAFLPLCPQADPDTTRCVAPREGFWWYSAAAGDVYADASGAAWLMDDSGVHPLTQEPGWRLTSVCPVSPHFGDASHLLFTRLGQAGTEICLLDLNTDEITVLCRSRETIVLVLRQPLFSYDPLIRLDWVLLCTASISQPDAASPVLKCRLLEVAGDVSFADGRYTANLRSFPRWMILREDDAASGKADFIRAYQRLYPDRTIRADRLVERTDLLDAPSFGMLYQEAYPGNIWLWRNGQAIPLAPGDANTTGLCDAMLLDLNGDGVQELAYVYSTGSGLCAEHARLYDPLKQQFTHLYAAMYTSPADALTLRTDASGECLLLKGGEPLGRVTRDGLDAGLNLSDFDHLIIDQSTVADVSAIAPGNQLLITSYGGTMSLPLADGTTLSLRFTGPELHLTGMTRSWRGLTLLDPDASSLPDLAAPVDEEALLALIAHEAAPEEYADAGLLSTCLRTVDTHSGLPSCLCFARTEEDLYLLSFTALQPDGYLFRHAVLRLNPDRAALEAIRPGMTLEEVRAISPWEHQYPFLHTGRQLPPISTHILPTGETLIVRYAYAEDACTVTSVEWSSLCRP